MTITDPEIQAYREHMAEHAIICKFMGIWPSERTLCQWIKQQWRPKGDVQLHLGAKGFFTVVFTSLEDKDRVFEGGPYFLAAAGLYIRPWKPNFVPERESFTQVPVWIRLFSLPIDYWCLSALKQIGDKLGTFVKASEVTMQKRYTTYARICVEMDVSGALHEGLWLEYRDEEYFQALDYEQIPFRCRKCHVHGHLVRECPLNRKEAAEDKTQSNTDRINFTKPKNRQRANRRRNTKGHTERNFLSNPFEILDPDTDSEAKKNIPEGEEERREPEKFTGEGKGDETFNGEIHMQDRNAETDEETDMLTSEGGSEDLEFEDTLAKEGLDLTQLVERWRAKGIEAVPEEEITKVRNLFIAQQKAVYEKQKNKLGIIKGNMPHHKLILGGTSGSRHKRRRGHKTDQEHLQEVGEMLINAGQIRQISEYPSFPKIV